MTMGDLLLQAAEQYPERDAVVYLEERLTYRELADRARQFARALIGLGIEPGEHVGVLMAGSPDCLAAYYGVALAGAVLVPINTRYRAAELPYVVANADLAAILTSDRIDDYVDLPGLLAESLAGLSAADGEGRRLLRLDAAPALRSVVSLGTRRSDGMLTEDEFLSSGEGVSEELLERRRLGVRVRGTALILYTSGTTSKPRGCLLTHEALVRCWTEIAAIYSMRADDRLWAPCPLFHLAGIGPMLMCAATGGANLSDTYFAADRALELLEREHATILYPAYPPITQAVLTHPRFSAAALSSARAILNVAPPDTLRQMQAALPHVTQLSLYGLTEGGGPITNNRIEDPLDVRVETVGGPVAGAEVRVVDPVTRVDVPVGVEGEIAIRGVTLCEGYHRDPEKTAVQFDRAGWYYTGDRGSLDSDGRLRFIGRLKDMLKVGGENVAPAEVEAQLALHPAVKLAQVVGVPDERLVEVVAAFVELRPEASATAEELMEHCRGQIASFKVPRHVRFVSEWPMSATKIQKEPLRQRLVEELGLTPVQ
jgi:acyl-CoA synthetase (AMP-forming)/AMP-acid ligase II